MAHLNANHSYKQFVLQILCSNLKCVSYCFPFIRANGSLKRPNLPEHCVPQILKHKSTLQHADTHRHTVNAIFGALYTLYTANQSRSYHLCITWIHQIFYINTNRHRYIKAIKTMFFYSNNNNKQHLQRNSVCTIKQSNLNLHHE